jgi:hypothetical protein
MMTLLLHDLSFPHDINSTLANIYFIKKTHEVTGA